MDGHFVPNISMGAPIVEALRQVTRLPLETHLMISDPDFFLGELTEAGSDSFLVHWEATTICIVQCNASKRWASASA